MEKGEKEGEEKKVGAEEEEGGAAIYEAVCGPLSYGLLVLLLMLLYGYF